MPRYSAEPVPQLHLRLPRPNSVAARSFMADLWGVFCVQVRVASSLLGPRTVEIQRLARRRLLCEARGVSKRFRRSYVLWEEGKAPDCEVEVSSPVWRAKERTKKRDLYAKLGVREYFLIDPAYENPHSEGRLKGFSRKKA